MENPHPFMIYFGRNAKNVMSDLKILYPQNQIILILNTAERLNYTRNRILILHDVEFEVTDIQIW
jgi:hypothetical protein